MNGLTRWRRSAVAAAVGVALLAAAPAAHAQGVTNPAQHPAPIKVTIDGQTYRDGQDTLPGYDDEACTPIPGVQYDFAGDQILYYDGDGELLATAHWTEWSRISSYQTWQAQQKAGAPSKTPTATPAPSSAPVTSPTTSGSTGSGPAASSPSTTSSPATRTGGSTTKTSKPASSPGKTTTKTSTTATPTPTTTTSSSGSRGTSRGTSSSHATTAGDTPTATPDEATTTQADATATAVDGAPVAADATAVAADGAPVAPAGDTVPVAGAAAATSPVQGAQTPQAYRLASTQVGADVGDTRLAGVGILAALFGLAGFGLLFRGFARLQGFGRR